MSAPKLPSDFPDLDLAAWRDALPMPEPSRPLALRRNAQPVLDAIIEREPKPQSPFEARGLRRSR